LGLVAVFLLHCSPQSFEAAPKLRGAKPENVKVRLDLSGLVQSLRRWEVKILSPDTAQPPFADLSVHRSSPLGRIENYAIVTLFARPGA